jgi:uncharacterized membrane protein
MALDHTRDYFSNYPFSPTDMAHPNTIMFTMRFLTHFCAPWFLLLAGTSVGFMLNSGKSQSFVARFLLSRGLWLIVIELVIIRFGCFLDYVPNVYYLGVLWVLGITMILLSAAIFLPMPVLFVLGFAGIALQNVVGGMIDSMTGFNHWLAILLQHQAKLTVATLNFDVDFPFMAWTCLAILGITFSRLWSLSLTQRVQSLLMLGFGCVFGFLILRGVLNVGDPNPFHHGETWNDSVLYFLNNEKYPPSLTFLLMTLGPGMFFLAACEYFQWQLPKLRLFGQVSLFFYMIHFPLINATAYSWFLLHDPGRVMQANMADTQAMRFEFGFYPMGVLLWWMLFIITLYFICSKFILIKQQYADTWWIRYI